MRHHGYRILRSCLMLLWPWCFRYGEMKEALPGDGTKSLWVLKVPVSGLVLAIGNDCLILLRRTADAHCLCARRRNREVCETGMGAAEQALWRMVVLAETQLWQTLRASVVDGR